MSAVAERVIGRDDELAAIEEFLGGRSPGSALLLEGEAGIGKTTLWEVGVESARERHSHVRQARPSGAETELSFAVLADLLEGAGEVLVELPLPQRRALEIALLLEDASDVAPDQRAVSVAF